MFYHYNCETMNGSICEIVVKAEDESKALDKLKSYAVNRGELRFYHLVAITAHGEEKSYKPENNGAVLAVALMGAAFGMSQVSQYGVGTDYKKALTEETVKIIKNNS